MAVSDLNPTENLWEIRGNKFTAKKPTTVTELWKRVEEDDHTNAVWETSDILWPTIPINFRQL